MHYTTTLALTLAILESGPIVYLPLATEGASSNGDTGTEVEQTRRLTSSLRKTARHLKALSDSKFRGLFHGFSAVVVYYMTLLFAFFVTKLILSPMFDILPNAKVECLLQLPIAVVLTSQFSMAALHMQISRENSSVSGMLGRFGELRWESVTSTLLPLMFFWSSVRWLWEYPIQSLHFGTSFAAKFAFNAGVILLLVVREIMRVLLLRIQASTLPEGVSTIVDIDPNFGVQKEYTKPFTLLEAAKTVSKEDALHILKMELKTWSIFIAFFSLFCALIWISENIPFAR